MVQRLSKSFLKIISLCTLVGVCSWLMYFLGTSIFLNSSLYERVVNTNPEETRVHFDQALSFFPGRVFIRGLEITGEDQNVQWKVKLPRVVVNVSLTQIFSKCLWVESLNADSVWFKIRLKSEEEGRIWPKSPKPTAKDVERWKTERWKLNILNVRIASVEMLQVQDITLTGLGTIGGSFYLWPGIDAEIGPAEIALKSGVVKLEPGWMQKSGLGSEISADHLNLKAQVKFHLFHPYSTPGNVTLKYLDIESTASGESFTSNLFNMYLRKAKGIRIRNRSSRFDAVLKVRKGRIVAGSAFDLEKTPLQIDLYGIRANGIGTIRVKTIGKNKKSRSEMKVDLRSLALYQSKFKDSFAASPLASFTVTSFDLSLLDPFKYLAMEFELPVLNFRHLEIFNRFYANSGTKVSLNSGSAKMMMRLFAFTGGKASILQKLKGTVKRTKAPGELRFSISDLVGKVDHFNFKTNLDTRFDLAAIDLESQEIRVPSGQLEMDRFFWRKNDRLPSFEALGKNIDKDSWWLKSNWRDILISFDPVFKVAGRFDFQAKDTLPLSDYVRELESFPYIKSHIIKTQNIKGSSVFEIEPQVGSLAWRLSALQIGGESRKFEGSLFREKGMLNGLLFAEVGIFSTVVSIKNGKTDIKARHEADLGNSAIVP